MKRSGVCAAGVVAMVAAAVLAAGRVVAQAQTSSSGAGASYVPAAVSGQSAPGTTSDLFGTFSSPSINPNGNLLFVGTLSTAANGTRTGIWTGFADGLSLVAREGSHAPSQPDNTIFGDLSASSPAQNSSSELVFNGPLRFTDNSGATDSLWLGTPLNAPSLILRSGTPAPGTNSNFGGIAGAVIHNGPSTAVHANLDNFDEGIWAGPVGSISLVARQFDPAPGTNDGSTYNGGFTNTPALNSSGQIAFSASLSRPGGSFLDRAIYVGSAGSLSMVARFGQPAPGTSATYFNFLGDPQLNNAGTVAFAVILDDNTRTIYAGTTGNLTLVARTGQTPPGVTNGTFSNLESPILGGGGHVTFAGSINDGNNTGIWSGLPDNVSLIAKTGQPAPATNNANFAILSTPIVNGVGQTAFRSTLTGGGAGIFAIDPFGRLVNVVSTGNQLPVSESVSKTVSGFTFATTSGGQDGRQASFNDSGQLTFQATFNDGSQGVFIARVGGAAQLTLQTPLYGPAASYDTGDTLVVPGDGTPAIRSAPGSLGYVNFVSPSSVNQDVLVYLKITGTGAGLAAVGRELKTSAAVYGYTVTVSPGSPPGDFNLLLTFAHATRGSSPQKFYWNLANIDDATLTQIGVVPEPASVTIVTLCGGGWLLMGREARKNPRSRRRSLAETC